LACSQLTFNGLLGVISQEIRDLASNYVIHIANFGSRVRLSTEVMDSDLIPIFREGKCLLASGHNAATKIIIFTKLLWNMI
jgi:hypothetical protein